MRRGIAFRKAVFSDLPESNSRHLGQDPRHYDPYTLAAILHPARNIAGELKCALASSRFPRRRNTSNAERFNNTVQVCQNLALWALSSRSALCALVGALFKKFGLFLNTPGTHLICLTVLEDVRHTARYTGIMISYKQQTRCSNCSYFEFIWILI
jgi:hypothetical protein